MDPCAEEGECVMAYDVARHKSVRRERPHYNMGSLTRGLLLGGLIASLVLALLPAMAHGETSQPVPVYQTLEELAGMRFAYVNGSVYNLNVRIA